MRVVGLLALAGALGAACSNKVSDMQLVCEAGERSGAMKLADPSQRASHTWQWIEANVHDEKVMKSLRSLAGDSGGPKEKAEILRLIAKENGYDGPCPMADEAEKPLPPPPLFGWWVIIEANGERHAALKRGQLHIAADETWFVWSDGTWEATATKTTQRGTEITFSNRAAFFDEGTVHGTLEDYKLVTEAFTAVPEAIGTAARLDAEASSKLPPPEICARALACAKEAALIKDKLELQSDPVRNLDGAGRTLCDAQLRGNAGMYERKHLPVPASCRLP